MNTEGQVAVKNAAGVAKLNVVMETWKNTLTKESEIEAFKKFLNGTDNLQLSADEQLVTITPTVNQATGGGHEIPVLVGDRACCLPKSTPEFFGLRKENVTEWLMVVENKFVTSKIDESNKVSTLLEFIKGDAGIMALSHIAKQGYDWILFREHLINTHQPVNEQRKLKKELKEWKQNGQSLCDYNKKFMMLTNRISGLSEEMILDYYIDNVNGKYGYVIDSVREAWRDLGKEMNVSQAMIQALNVDAFSSTHKNGEINHIHGRPVKKPQYANNTQTLAKCFKCNKSNHLTKDCYSNKTPTNGGRKQTVEKNGAKDISKIECHACKKLGHYANKCPTKAKQNKTIQNNAIEVENHTIDIDFEINMMSVKQFCKKRETKAIYAVTELASCEEYLMYADETEELYYAKALVNSNHGNTVEANALIDSASTVCAMSYEYAVANKIEILPMSATVSTINGRSQVKGITKPILTTVLTNYDCMIRYFVVESRHEIILGLPWMKAVNGGVVYEGSVPVLNIGGAKFSLISFRKIKQINYVQAQNEIMHDVTMSEAITIPDDEDLDYEVGWDLESDAKIEVKSSTPLKREEEKLFKQLKVKIKKNIATDLSQLGKAKLGAHKINMVDDSPTYQAQYRMAPAERLAVKTQCDEYLKAGIISPSFSPNSAPIILVKKKDGGLRMCLIYKKLNLKMKTERFPIPRVDDILEQLAQNRYFSKIDLKSGFHQIPLAAESKQHTSFMTPDGAYEFNVAPFGLQNLPFDFSRKMAQAFMGIKCVTVFIDDICIFSQTILQHILDLEVVFDRLIETGLMINISKCDFITEKLIILGHIIEHGQIKMDEGKIEAISKQSAPLNVKQVQQFLGICNYYRKFVKNYAEMARPMVKLLCKDTEWVWNSDCQASFEKL